MRDERINLVVSPSSRLKTWAKRAVLRLYEGDWITRRFAQRLIDLMGARLA